MTIKNNYFFLLLLILIATTSSCSHIKDVTSDNRYHKGYRPGDLYTLNTRVFLTKYDNYALNHPDKGGLPDFVTYSNDPNKWKWPHIPDIIGLVEEGTVLKITKLINESTFESNNLWVYGKIMTGQFKDREVIVNFISRQSDVWLPPGFPVMDIYDPKFLKKME